MTRQRNGRHRKPLSPQQEDVIVLLLGHQPASVDMLMNIMELGAGAAQGIGGSLGGLSSRNMVVVAHETYVDASYGRRTVKYWRLADGLDDAELEAILRSYYVRHGLDPREL